MTLKVENISSWVAFGYGKIGKVIEGKIDPDDPQIMFIHKKAVAGKFHEGVPVLTPKEEAAMEKEVAAFLNLLSSFHDVADDFIRLPDDYNQPRGPRRSPVSEDTMIETPKEEPVAEKRGRGWNLRKGAKDTKTEPVVETPKVEAPVAEKRGRGWNLRKKAVEQAPPVAEAPVVEKRPRGWNLRKGAKDTKAAEPVVETPPAPVRTRAEKRPVIKAPEPAPAPVAEKRGRGWNLRKGAKDTKASETTPPVDVLVMSDNPPEVDARRVASRRNTGIATEPVKADKEKLPAKVRSGRLTVA